MSRKQKLYLKAKESPNNFKFTDLCSLAEKLGCNFRKHKGTSHRTYIHPKTNQLFNFQDAGGQAKAYQVRQLLNYIDDHNLMEGGE